jgi:hypothetical protein
MGTKDNSRQFLDSAPVRSAPAALWQTASDGAESFIGACRWRVKSNRVSSA